MLPFLRFLRLSFLLFLSYEYRQKGGKIKVSKAELLSWFISFTCCRPKKSARNGAGGGCVPLLCVGKNDSRVARVHYCLPVLSLFSARHRRLCRLLHQRSLIINFANLAFPQNYPTLCFLYLLHASFSIHSRSVSCVLL
jgi:hypothetical protein